jgi:hypothetical protein
MVRYRRNFVAGGTFFFTVTLADRASRVLIDHVEALRAAMRQTRGSHPFTIDAVVVLPEHRILYDAGCCRKTGVEISARIKEPSGSGAGDPDFATAQSGLRAE